MKLAIVLGTRPEILKLAPLVRECDRRGTDYSIIHTGQHYSENLDDVFFELLDLPAPDYDLEVGSLSHGKQTGRLLEEIESILLADSFDVVAVQGDTNSVLAGAIAASKLDVELAHVEAGLRSFDRRMPEEVNRKLTDHVSDYLFAPTRKARDLLRAEGIPDDGIHVTGNTIVDAVTENRPLAHERSSVLEDLGLGEETFYLLTAHRAGNVDEYERFVGLLDGVSRFAAQHEARVVYPIHPRARKQLDAFDIGVPDEIELVDPLEYLDFLLLEDEADLVFTDSGGVQEEACILRTPCVTLRDNTERPETIDVRANALAGVDPTSIVECGDRMLSASRRWENPFGDGKAAKRILDVLLAETGEPAVVPPAGGAGDVVPGGAR